MAVAKSVALALGSGGARGLAHIAVVEALDELGVTPVAVAGTSIGALIGAGVAAGLRGREIRHHIVHALRDPADVVGRLLSARVGRFADVFSRVIGNPLMIDALAFCRAFLPPDVPERFEDLRRPLTVVTTDFHERCECAYRTGELRPAIAGSIAVPGLLRAVEFDGRVLIDGGAVNPLPFDHLRGVADIILAVDVARGAVAKNVVPNATDAVFGTISVMGQAIVAEKLKSGPPDIVIRPNVEAFQLLDFFRVGAILRAAEPAKEEVKRRLGAMLG